MRGINIAEHPMTVALINLPVVPLHPSLPPIVRKFRLHGRGDKRTSVVAIAERDEFLSLVAAAVAGSKGAGLIPKTEGKVIRCFDAFAASSGEVYARAGHFFGKGLRGKTGEALAELDGVVVGEIALVGGDFQFRHLHGVRY